MSFYSPSIEKLIESFEKLPSIGHKTAQRLAFYMLDLSDEEVKEFTEELVPEELKELNQKENRSDEENARMEELTNKVNSEYQEFLMQKGNEEVKDIEDILTMDEYSDIVEVNAGNDVEINGNKIAAADFLEIVYDLFVKE